MLTEHAVCAWCFREAKYLQRMGVHVPEVACTLLLQEEKFKFYFAQLSHLVSCQADVPCRCCIRSTEHLIASSINSILL